MPFQDKLDCESRIQEIQIEFFAAITMVVNSCKKSKRSLNKVDKLYCIQGIKYIILYFEVL
jgi:hypothetical protein